MKLTERQQRFVEAYAETANAVESARRAGYKSPHPEGVRLLRNPTVADALKLLASKRRRAAIMSQQERHELLSTIARDRKAKEADRIRATEVLMRANGEFASVAVVTPPGAAPVVVPTSGDDDNPPIVTIYLPNNGRSSAN